MKPYFCLRNIVSLYFPFLCVSVVTAAQNIVRILEIRYNILLHFSGIFLMLKLENSTAISSKHFHASTDTSSGQTAFPHFIFPHRSVCTRTRVSLFLLFLLSLSCSFHNQGSSSSFRCPEVTPRSLVFFFLATSVGISPLLRRHAHRHHYSPHISVSLLHL